jgi:hypothetical protein
MWRLGLLIPREPGVGCPLVHVHLHPSLMLRTESSEFLWMFTEASTFSLAPSCGSFCHTLPIPHTMTSGCMESWFLFLLNMQGDT